jgi:hypothetical protein
MAEQPQGWRVVVIANVLPIAEPLIARVGEMGHDVVRGDGAEGHRPPPPPGAETPTRRRRRANLIWGRDRQTSRRSCGADVVLAGASLKIRGRRSMWLATEVTSTRGRFRTAGRFRCPAALRGR